MGDIENIIKNNPLNKLSFKGISLLGLIATAAYSVTYITYLVEFADVSWRYALTHVILYRHHSVVWAGYIKCFLFNGVF